MRDLPPEWRSQIEETTSRTGIQWARDVVIDESFEGATNLYTVEEGTWRIKNRIWTVDYNDHMSKFDLRKHNRLTACSSALE